MSDLLEQFRSLRDHGDYLGFRKGNASMPASSPTEHWQGVQRPMTGAGKYLVVSRSGRNESFVIVKMGSRDSSGHRFRSNRIGESSASVSPPNADVVVKKVSAVAGFDHSGGIQMLGRYLAVGSEEGASSVVTFYDLANPEAPVKLGTLPRNTTTSGAGTTSMAKLQNGRYLLIVGGAGATRLDFYVSKPNSTLSSPQFDFITTWQNDDVKSAIPSDRTFAAYQSLNLVTDGSGALYLIGTHRSGTVAVGSDWADLFLVRSSGSHSVEIIKVAKRHLYCAVPGILGMDQCNLDAAGGVYVTPDNRLLLYATEHYAMGPSGSVKLEEFRPAPHRDSCSNIDEAWVELYDDDHFDGDRSVMIDYVDRNKRNYDNYDKVEGFEDKTSAARWCLPSGWKYRLYEDKKGCGGAKRDLVGTGRPKEDKNFGNDQGVANFGDKVSCSKWISP